MFKVYTPQDANRILPELNSRFNEIVLQKNQVVSLQEELQKIIDAGSPFKEFFKKKQDLNRAVASLYKSIEQLEDLGVMIKSVDEGLLDLPSRRFNEEVWLCWKIGESEVRFWHTKEEGFMGRKPLIPKGSLTVEQTDDLSDLR
jgi:hypothetical protein